MLLIHSLTNYAVMVTYPAPMCAAVFRHECTLTYCYSALNVMQSVVLSPPPTLPCLGKCPSPHDRIVNKPPLLWGSHRTLSMSTSLLESWPHNPTWKGLRRRRNQTPTTTPPNRTSLSLAVRDFNVFNDPSVARSSRPDRLAIFWVAE